MKLLVLFRESIDDLGWFLTLFAPISFVTSISVYLLGIWEFGIRPFFP